MAQILPFEAPPLSSPDPLAALTELVAGDLAAVNSLIIERMESSVAMIPQLAGYIIAAGGKRLRPLLTLACAQLCQAGGPRLHKLAAAVEFIHTATLLHDDVVDASDLRRGTPSANAVFGNQASVLVGDFLFSRAFQLMVEDGSLDILRILSNASAIISEGEVLQLTTAQDSATGEQAYLDVIRAKTAELFAAACRIGAVAGNRPAAEEEALRTYGLNLGIAFQIVDDVLDYSARQEQLGKTVGDDFREGKMTLPVILAIMRGDDTERAFWRRTMESMEQTPEDFSKARMLLHKHNALSGAIERARHYGAIAREALGLFPDQSVRKILMDIVEFTIAREY